jgi:hypothetical protein
MLIDSIRSIVAKQDYIGRSLPSSYLHLERVLAERAKAMTPPVLTWHAYSELARLCAIEVDSKSGAGDDLRTATALLHNLGSLVHFGDESKVCAPACSLSSRLLGAWPLILWRLLW